MHGVDEKTLVDKTTQGYLVLTQQCLCQKIVSSCQERLERGAITPTHVFWSVWHWRTAKVRCNCWLSNDHKEDECGLKVAISYWIVLLLHGHLGLLECIVQVRCRRKLGLVLLLNVRQALVQNVSPILFIFSSYDVID